jgi:hypothetical protein
VSNPWNDLAKLCSVQPGQESLAARQWRWLQDCLSRNKGTEFGQQHHFDAIDSIDAYRQQVPIQAYEEYADRIERMAQGETDILFTGKPAAFERTGGSSGGSKLIPYSQTSLVDFQVALLPWLASLVAGYDINNGSAYWSISPAMRQAEVTPGGVPVGLPDGAYLGDCTMRAFAEVSAVPPWVGDIDNVAGWELATLYWLIRRADLVLVSVWSPTFFVQLLDRLDRRREELLALLSHGGNCVRRFLPGDKAALQRLSSYYRKKDTRQLWPVMKLVSCWTDASSRPYADELQSRFPGVPIQGKGLLATEGVTSTPDKEGRPVLAADSGFYEFLNDSDSVRSAWELRQGDCCEVIMTTSGGLYRYPSGDRVRCEGFADDVPILVFVGRSGLVSDLVGEKLTEAFVAQCLQSLPGFRMLVPVEGAGRYYTLVTERRYAAQSKALLPAVESQLVLNPQYAYARRLGQLGELTLTVMDDPLGLYMEHVAEKQRLGDVKVPALCPQNDRLVSRLAGTP